VHASRVPFFEMLGIKMCANVTIEQKRATKKHREEIFAAFTQQKRNLLTGRQKA
jgi:FMN-dependent NADH-azoreductase